MAAAAKLYREKGFDGVTIAAIADEADVAPRTFFSYFECKEDAFLGAGDDRLLRVVQAIQGRAPNEPILQAALRELASTGASSPESPGLRRLLAEPSIRERLRERWIRWEDVLSECIAAEVGARADDPEPRVVAAAITAAIRVAADAVQRQPARRRRTAVRVFRLLATGLAGYGKTGDVIPMRRARERRSRMPPSDRGPRTR